MPEEKAIEKLIERAGLEPSQVPSEWADFSGADVMLCPADVEGLCAIHREADALRVPLYPVGGGTSLDWGFPGTEPGIAVSTRQLEGVVDYPARDLTITVRAGTTVATLQETLRSEGQWLPVEVPLSDRATVGGAIAANVNGPRRFGYGTWRDYVIGIGVVTADGKFAKAGGRVVKNVAGYDLCKLYTGSFGSLAVIAEVTLKLRPLPEKTELVAVRCDDAADVEAVLAGTLTSRTRPVLVDLLSAGAWEQVSERDGSGNGWWIVVGFEGFEEAVAWQVETFVDEVRRWTGGRGKAEVVHSNQVPPLLERLASFAASGPPPVAKVNYLPSRTPSMLGVLGHTRVRWRLQAHANNGVAWLVPEPGEPEEDVVADLVMMRRWATEAEGNLVVRGAAFCARRQFAPWGAERNDTWLMRRLKERFDPNGILNPGRFLDHPQAVEKSPAAVAEIGPGR